LKALIADDHALLRVGLTSALGQLGDGPLVCFEAADAAQVTETLRAHPDLDLVLLDLFMPGANGFELLSNVCNAASDAPVVVLSASEDTVHMRKALDCGASGYISKSAPRDVMISALRLVLAGGIYVPPDLVRAQPPDAASRLTGVIAAAALTARQQDVLRLLGQGRSNKRIARELDVAENTVKIHVAAILRALGAANRTEAAVIARAQGFDFGDSPHAQRAPPRDKS